MCWGDNIFGQLGIDGGTTLMSTTAVAPTGLTSGVTSLCAGYMHSPARSSAVPSNAGGGNNTGQLGVGDMMNRVIPTGVMERPLPARPGSRLRLHVHVRALRGGDVYCWGFNQNGQLGTTDTNPRQTATKVVWQ